MATSPPRTSPPLELATDFEQWFAKKVKAVSIQANVSIPLSPEWKVVINQQFRTTLNQAIPAYEFRLFPYLPKELRVKIWKFGAFVPRVIHLHPDSNAKPLSICRQRAPIILHACHESRTVALPQFKVLFEPNLDLPRTHSQTIYVQPEVDTYYVRVFIGQPFVQAAHQGNFNLLHSCSLHPIKKLALEYDFFERIILDDLWQAHTLGRDTLMKFRDLETLVIAVELNDFGDEYTEDGKLVPGYRRSMGKHIELINTINPIVAAEDPSNPHRFETNRPIDSQLELRFGCSSDERPWKLQGLFDRAREVMRDMWLKNRAWKIPQVEICAVVRDSEGR